MTRWIEQNEKMLGGRLGFRPHGTEGDGSLLGPGQIVDVDVKVHLFRYRPLGPRRSDIVLNAHGDQQQHAIDGDDGVVFRGDGNAPAE